jgi:hypothetical protein
MSQTVAPKDRVSFLLLLLLGAFGVACLAALLLPARVRGGPSKRGRIVNNLRQIDGAKQFWALEHHSTGSVQLTSQDLATYLRHLGHARSRDGFVASVDGERYLINALDVPPEARLSRQLGNLPAGAILRLDTDAQTNGGQPNPQGGANGRQPFGSETNGTSPAAASHRSP